MAEISDPSWENLMTKVRGPCQGCPRNGSKMPVLLARKGSLKNVSIIVLSQEPGFWLRASSNGEVAGEKLVRLCRETKGADQAEAKKANPLSKLLQIFGNFDPTCDSVYWSHALKCVPAASDRDINKEWRKAATRCEEYFLEEVRLLGKADLSIVVFGKYALELCLHAFNGEDIDQELSISEHMQSNRMPLTFKYKFKDGTSKNVALYVYTNPSSEVVNIKRSGGKLTVEDIQNLETAQLRGLLSR